VPQRLQFPESTLKSSKFFGGDTTNATARGVAAIAFAKNIYQLARREPDRQRTSD